jgi:imidazolonepropionase-like amidohydrolase
VLKRGCWMFLLFVYFPTYAGAQASATQAAPTTTVIRAGRLIDVDAGKELANQVIVIRNGKIVSVGGASAAIPAGATVLDLSGMTVLPGLIDCHTHLVGTAQNFGDARV